MSNYQASGWCAEIERNVTPRGFSEDLRFVAEVSLRLAVNHGPTRAAEMLREAADAIEQGKTPILF